MAIAVHVKGVRTKFIKQFLLNNFLARVDDEQVFLVKFFIYKKMLMQILRLRPQCGRFQGLTDKTPGPILEVCKMAPV